MPLAIFIVLVFAAHTHAQSGTGSTYRFLNVPASASALALGGGPVSLPHGEPALMHLNPALLSKSHHGHVSLSFGSYLSESNMGFISGAWYSEKIGTLGAGLRFLNYGTMDRIDEFGLDRGTFHASDVALKLAIGRVFENVIQYGLAADLIYSSYESYRSTGFMLSGGVLYSIDGDDLTIGASFMNLGRQLSTYDGIQEPLPFDLRLGLSRKLLYLPLRITFTAHNLHRWEMRTPGDDDNIAFFTNLFRHLAVGGEFLFSENFHLRLGYNHLVHDELKTDRRLDLVGFGIGVGIKYKGIGIDLGRNSYSNMGNLFQLGIHTIF